MNNWNSRSTLHNKIRSGEISEKTRSYDTKENFWGKWIMRRIEGRNMLGINKNRRNLVVILVKNCACFFSSHNSFIVSLQPKNMNKLVILVIVYVVFAAPILADPIDMTLYEGSRLKGQLTPEIYLVLDKQLRHMRPTKDCSLYLGPSEQLSRPC